ncbi:MAG TPA: ABC transporter ATP-binding protein [Candidatus Saccharimonadia bacterium]|nr:ABC transporter ATP-binding protein [Candidatus Saccharimonadia bacterium]
MSPDVVLSVKNLTKIYPGKEKFVAVDHISFDLHGGEILGLLGPNGAGKTTTIQMLLSTLKPTSGEISYFGKNFYTHRSEVLKYISFASTYIRLPWRLTVNENLIIYGRLFGLTNSEIKSRVEKFLKFFGVWKMRDKEVSSLSAGQTTRVMLAKAFLAYPKIALLDEPTASLDPDIAHEVRAFVLEQQKSYDVSMLFTSHNMDEVSAVCNRVMFLQHGKIVANDEPDKIARSVSTAHIELTVGDGLKRTVEYAKKQKFAYEIDDRAITIAIDEHKIAALLENLAKVGVNYTQIAITKPTLEDYFLQLSKTEQKKGAHERT